MIRKKLVFVSCGQETDAEQELGRRLCATIDGFPRTRSFYAQLAHSPTDLNSYVFDSINRCDAFFAVLHNRGSVQYRGNAPITRSSVWIQQEIAILCFRMFIRKVDVPVRVYMEDGILLEGLMKTAIVNPVLFKESNEVLVGLKEWLSGRDFEVEPLAARRDAIFRHRSRSFGEKEWLLVELIAAHTPTFGDRVPPHTVRDDFKVVYEERGRGEADWKPDYDRAFAAVSQTGLIDIEYDNRPMTVQLTRRPDPLSVSIARQWRDLVLEELRAQGRNL